jgi:arsenate reductase
MSIVLFGLRNCDTMKKAANWLQAHGLDCVIHDYRRDGLDAERLQAWCRVLGREALINTRGTTWRKLSPAQQAIRTEADAVQLMLEQPALIRRPVLEAPDGQLLVGFDPQHYGVLLKTEPPLQA